MPFIFQLPATSGGNFVLGMRIPLLSRVLVMPRPHGMTELPFAKGRDLDYSRFNRFLRFRQGGF